MKIVLLGFMCAGKTAVGRVLAAKLGWPHIDTDAMIEAQAGKGVADLIRRHGEGFFRDLERQAVLEACRNDRVVISTGGGVPLDPANMTRLSEDSETVWLHVTPRAVLERAGDLRSRPILDPADPLGSVETLLRERRDFYAAARHAVKTDGRTPHDIADEILKVVPGIPK